MSETFLSQQNIMKEIISLLLKERKLVAVESEGYSSGNSLGFALLIHVQDQNKDKYSLLINHNNNPNDVHTAKIKSKYLKQFNHPNIIKYIDDFTLGSFYFIQTERIQTCLFDWVNNAMLKNPIREQDFVEIALQMLEVTKYLNTHKCSLYLQSTLTSFTIDEEMKIKLIHFTTPQQINIAKVKSIFNKCKEENKLFYYKKDILKMNNKSQMQQNFDVDLWAIGICLYYLSGASTSQILSYILDEDSFQVSEFLGFQNNIKLYSLISDKRNLYFLPSFSANEYQKQENKRSSNSNSITGQYVIDQTRNYHQIKEDFQIFKHLYKQLYDSETDIEQGEKIKYYIETYGESDSLLSLQTRYYIENRNFEEAILRAQQIIEMNPYSDIGYYSMGSIYDKKKQFTKSIDFYQKSIDVNPWNDNACYNIGATHQDLKSKKAIQYYKKAADIDCNKEDTFCNLGAEYQFQKKFRHAILSYKKAFKISSEDSDTLYNLGYTCCYSQSKFEQSIRFNKKLIKIDGDDFDSAAILNSAKQSI